MVFPAVMHGCELDYKERWAPKNWCFWTVVLEKTLESPLDCKEIQPVSCKGNQFEYSLEGLMLNLKLQYFGHLMWRTNSFEKTQCWEILKAGGEEDDSGDMVGWHHQLEGHEFEEALGVGVGKEAWHAEVHKVTKCWTWLSDWMDVTKALRLFPDFDLAKLY